MKTLASILIPIVTSTSLFASEFLKPREWTSSDGKKLKAELISWNGDTVKLKRATDGKKFDLPTAKLSETDIDLLKAESEKIANVAKSAVINPFQRDDSDRSFVGFPKSDEETWALAQRLGKLDDFTNALGKHWEPTRSKKIVTFSPRRFVRENANSYLIVGQYVAVRIVSPDDTNLSAGGDKLTVVRGGNDTDGRNEKLVISQRGIDFTPSLDKEQAQTMAVENVGLDELLVFTIRMKYMNKVD